GEMVIRTAPELIARTLADLIAQPAAPGRDVEMATHVQVVLPIRAMDLAAISDGAASEVSARLLVALEAPFLRALERSIPESEAHEESAWALGQRAAPNL